MGRNGKVPELDPEALEAAARAFWDRSVFRLEPYTGQDWDTLTDRGNVIAENTRRATEAAIVAYLREVAIVVDRELHTGPRDRAKLEAGSPAFRQAAGEYAEIKAGIAELDLDLREIESRLDGLGV